MNYLTITLLTLVFLYFIILITVYFFQRNLLYHPTENNYTGDKLEVLIKKVIIETQDNIPRATKLFRRRVTSTRPSTTALL